MTNPREMDCPHTMEQAGRLTPERPRGYDPRISLRRRQTLLDSAETTLVALTSFIKQLSVFRSSEGQRTRGSLYLPSPSSCGKGVRLDNTCVVGREEDLSRLFLPASGVLK